MAADDALYAVVEGRCSLLRRCPPSYVEVVFSEVRGSSSRSAAHDHGHNIYGTWRLFRFIDKTMLLFVQRRRVHSLTIHWTEWKGCSRK